MYVAKHVQGATRMVRAASSGDELDNQPSWLEMCFSLPLLLVIQNSQVKVVHNPTLNSWKRAAKADPLAHISKLSLTTIMMAD